MKANQGLKFKKDENAIIGVDFILAAILILIISVMAIAIVYPIIGASYTHSSEHTLVKALGANETTCTPISNATRQLITSTGTSLGLAPMMALSAVAAGIISLLLYAFGSVSRQGL